MKKEYWVKNRSGKELISSELNLKIPIGKPVNLFALNPNLTHENLAKSEESGFLAKHLHGENSKLTKIVEVVARPEIKKATITESKQFMPSRRKSAIVVDTKEHNYIEELSSFDEAVAAGYDVEGFSDPISQVMGHDGERFDDDKPFVATVVNQRLVAAKSSVGNPVRLVPKLSADGEVLVDIE